MRSSHEHTEKIFWNDESERERRRVDAKGGLLRFDVISDNFSLFCTERERERERKRERESIFVCETQEEGIRSILL